MIVKSHKQVSNRKRRQSRTNYEIPDKFEEKFELNKLNLS